MCVLNQEICCQDFCNQTFFINMAAPLSRACLRRLKHCRLKNGSVLKTTRCQPAGIHFTATRNHPTTEHDDFYGIEEDQKDGSRSEFVDSAGERATEKERQKLLRSLETKKPNRELVLQTGFGQVRLDGKTKKSLQEVNPQQFFHAVSQTVFDQNENKVQTSKLDGKRSLKKKKTQKLKEERFVEKTNKDKDSLTRRPATNYFDEQYFQSLSEMCEGAVDPLTMTVSEVRGQPLTVLQDERPSRVVEMPDNASTSRWLNGEETTSTDSRHDTHNNTASITGQQQPEHNFLDEMYFPSLTTDSSSADTVDDCQNSSSFIDDQYFSPRLHESSETFPCGGNISQSTPVQNTLSEEQVCKLPQTGIPDFDDHSRRSSDHAYDVEVLDNVSGPSVNAVPNQAVRTVSEASAGAEQQSAQAEFSFIDEQYFDSQSDGSSLDNAALQYGIAGEETARVRGTSSSVPQEKENQTRSETGFDRTAQSDCNIQDRPQSSSLRQRVSTSGSDDGEVKDSAYTAAMKLRKNVRLNLSAKDEEAHSGKENANRGKLVEGRVQIFKDQVPDLNRMPAMEVTQLLADSLLFENDDFIAVNKPYGLPSHGGPGVRVSIGQVLEPLAHRLDSGRGRLDNLHLVHRLDKETTGIMLLAKSAEVAWQLLGMFRRREVGKTYWTVTKGLPQPLEGVVDIPLARKKVNGIYKTVVMPKEYVSEDKVRERSWNRRGDNSAAAVTQYKVVAHCDSMALVECRPLTGVQHQIRAHLAQALNAPVLGDHKYSHMDKLAPQKLFPEALQKLGLRQAQVRYVPMHLHAKALLLPEWRGRSNLFIAAPIPRFFLRNLKTLKIKIPSR